MHFLRNQMYVESLVPQGGVTQKDPIIFVHGQGQTGTVSYANHPIDIDQGMNTGQEVTDLIYWYQELAQYP